ncbi:MAG: hypothetical protein DHS20C14_06070 [Phycisphaeraceae bacterium]|nr:MAG: hypothetical protein DHS20C14_06070 [Phycisphaeraceae bacterium]
MTAPTATKPTTVADPHAMRCLELWGGTGSAREAASVPGLDIYVRCDPYRGAESGGDIYYVSMCGAGNIARIVLADVSGHGADVADASRLLRTQMRRNINTVDQTRMARQLNAQFGAEGDGTKFATALLMTYFAPSNHLVIVNAGHPPPLIWRAAKRAWSYAEAEDAPATPDAGVSNLPLGIIEPTGYEQFALPIEPGDVALLYTDALPETADESGAQLGQAGLLELVRSLSEPAGETIGERVADALEQRRNGAPPEDDQTIVAISHNGATPPGLSMGEHLRVIGRMIGIGRLGP